MGEPIKQGLRKNSWFLLLAATVATFAAIAFVVQAAYAEHGGPHIKVVPSDNPNQDLSAAPLVLLNTGDRASIDFLIRATPITTIDSRQHLRRGVPHYRGRFLRPG